MDRLYTLFELADWLLNNGVTMIDTLMSNRVGIPPYVKDVSNRETVSSEIFCEKNGKINISYYVVQNASKKKNSVMVLSTVDPILGITNDDEKNKPALYKLYDFTKGGTDIVDQKRGTYTMKPKLRRWLMVAFSYLLDTVRVNASTVWSLLNDKEPSNMNSFGFGYTLTEQLDMPAIIRRNKNGLSSSIVKKKDCI